MKKVLIADEMHESITQLLSDAGLEPDYRPEIDRSGILEAIGNYEGLIIRSKTNVDREMIDKANKLEFVARAGAGVDKVDYEYLEEKNIQLFNAPEGNRDAVGEHAIGMLLSLFHKLNQGNSEVKSSLWDREGNRGYELKGRTVGIFGFGFMGSSLAEKLSGFGCRVIAYDKYKTGFTGSYVEEVSYEEFERETEILSIHVPLTEETRMIFDEESLSRFGKLRVVINTARGEVLDLQALLELMKTGKLIGACLDVLENEKINKLSADEQAVFDELRKMDNVLLSPHVAGWTFESYERINQVLVNKLQEAGMAH